MRVIVLIVCLIVGMVMNANASDYIIKTIQPKVEEVRDSKGKVVTQGKKKIVEYTQLLRAMDETDKPVVIKDQPIQIGMEQAVQNIRQLETQIVSNTEQFKVQDARLNEQLVRWKVIKAELEK